MNYEWNPEDNQPERKTLRFAIVVSTYYEDVAQRLLDGALEVLKSNPRFEYEVVRVKGAWEIPIHAMQFIQSTEFHGVIALGCVIRGETTHYDLLCNETARKLMNMSVGYMKPVGFGILTVENESQAIARSQTKKGGRNKGAEAAEAVIATIYSLIETLNLIDGLEEAADDF